MNRLIALALLLSGCALQQASRPSVAPDLDGPTRAKLYDAYSLNYEASAWAPRWKRGDGEYGYGQLDDLLDAYPETGELKHRIAVRDGVIGGLAATGGGLAGFILGYNLTARGSARMATGTEIALLAGGAGLVLAAVATALTWPNPADHLADTYNDALKKQLRVQAAPPPAAARVRIAPAVVSTGRGVAAGAVAVGQF